jgi:glycosyltransferase involved in cell wall biosynthesis
VSFVLPSYNEGSAIKDTVRQLTSGIGEGVVQVVVVDDGSNDGSVSPAITEDVMSARITVVSAVRRRGGKGWAIREGVRKADAPLIVVLDADGPIPVAEVARGLSVFASSQEECLVGVRRHTSLERRAASRFRRAAAWGLRRALRWDDLDPASDPFCPLKVFRGGSPTADALLSTKALGYLIDVEFRYALDKAGIPVRDEPVDWVDSRGPARHILRRYSPTRVLRDLRATDLWHRQN